MDPVAVALQNMLPLPNQAGITNNYVVPGYQTYTHTTNESFKIDQSLSPTIKVSGYFSRLETQMPAANGFPTTLGGATATDDVSYTTRLNYDQSLRPTLLLHLGIGYFQNYEPVIPTAFNQSSNGLNGYFDPNFFPTISGLTNFISGGWGSNFGGLGAGFGAQIWEQKPTAHANLT